MCIRIHECNCYSIAGSDQFAFSHETNQPTQYISIVVNSINPAVKPFTLRLNSLDYGELKDRLQAPLRNARNIVIHQSLSDRFVDAFKEQVYANGRYRLGSEMPASIVKFIRNTMKLLISNAPSKVI